MVSKIWLGTAGMLVLLGTAAHVPAAATAQPTRVTQATTSSEQAQAKDDEVTRCSRYRAAYKRLDAVKLELTQLRPNFAATDDISPKLDELVTQTNDLMMTTKVRVDSCPLKLR